jgi:RHS repeat-associated protein
VTLEVGYGYDTYGRPESLTTPSGQTLTYEYTNGQLSGLKVNGAWLLSQIAYQPFGPPKDWQWGNGTSTARTYDTDGRLTHVSSAGNSSYTFFLDGTIATRTDDFTPSIPSPSGTTTFTLASTSNRVQSTTGELTRSYSYDAAGNTTSDGTRTFTYNDAGRMRTSTDGGVTTTYSYNGLGERVKKTSSAATVHFAYDEAGHLIGEYDASGDLVQETVWFGDIPVAVLTPDGSGIDVYYVHTDHLNTPRRITRPSDDEIVWRWDSDPFGATAANDDPDDDTVTFAYNLRFPGQYFDPETGLHYNYFRDYDAVTGRYIQSDPIGLDGGINTYGYVGGNPLAGVDPSGLACVAANGMVSCSLPNGQSITFPRPWGWPDRIDSSNSLHHQYAIAESRWCVNEARARQAVINDPTPGWDLAARPSGQYNNASPTPLLLPTFSPVKSYVMPDGTTVNVTLPGHPLHPGYVARVTSQSSDLVTITNYGEGLGVLQSPSSFVADAINGVWRGQTRAILDSLPQECLCQ